jgi:hypothetical protein
MADKSVKPADTMWSVVKALGLRALTTGKFWQFCGMVILVALIWRIDSPDWVKISELILRSPLFIALGWFLFVGLIMASVVLFNASRRMYLAEIQRLVEERNRLQGQLLDGNIQRSAFKP